MYRLNLQQIMHDSNIFNLTTVREQLKKDYNITDIDYFKCLDWQNIEFFDNLKIPGELLELMKHKHQYQEDKEDQEEKRKPYRPAKILFEDIKKEDIELYETKGITLDGLGKKYFVSGNTIKRLFTLNGIGVKSNAIPLDFFDPKDVQSYANKEMTAKEMCEKYHISRSGLSYVMERNGIYRKKSKYR
jgi:hypothetical protein